MSHKPFNEREVRDATPEQMREDLDKYFEHVRQHDPKSIKFALMVAGHGEANGDTRICALIGGPPQTIAHVITQLMDELVERDPAFALFFLINFLQRMRSRQGVDVEVVDFDSTGGADVEAQVKDLINKLRKTH